MATSTVAPVTIPTTKPAKPESIKTEPWSEFPRQPYSFITDDFVHEKLGVLKVNASSSKATVNIKETVAYDKKGALGVSDEVKFYFALPQGASFYSKVKSNDYLKIHYDHGTTSFFERTWNFYATVNATKSLKDLSYRVGVAHLSKVCNSDSRLRVKKGESETEVTLYNRTTVTHNKFTFGVVGAYEVARNLISKNSILLGYKVDDKTSVYLRAENGFRKSPIALSDWKNYFDHFKFDAISSIDSETKVGLEVQLNIYIGFFRPQG